MAKVILKFNETVLKEIQLDLSQLTIGRKSDNDLVIDNPAVSGHHAKITELHGAFVLEDLGSASGTIVNDHKIIRQQLKSGDRVMIGKHVLDYHDEVKHHPAPPPPRLLDSEKTFSKPTAPEPPAQPEFPKVEEPVMVGQSLLGDRAETERPAATLPPEPSDSEKAFNAPAVPEPPAPSALHKEEEVQAEEPKPKERFGVLQIVEGRTDRKEYPLAGRMAIIGAQAGATVKLRGWFAPKTAALISRRHDEYSVSLSKEGKDVRLNGLPIQGRVDLKDGDLLEVAGVKMYFYLKE